MNQIDAAACLGTHNVVFITLDTLRYDVAEQARIEGDTPHFDEILPESGWEERHSPASFTYAAHLAFFAGFLPTPKVAVRTDASAHHRLFASVFPGSETTGRTTLVFDAPDIVNGFEGSGYRTVCVGGTGFFNKLSPLGQVLPNMFQTSFWEKRFDVTTRTSAQHQTDCLVSFLDELESDQRFFAFLNYSACHPPHAFFLDGESKDSLRSQQKALASIDREIPKLINSAARHAPLLLIVCSDHGCAFGEDGYRGHRLGHPTVWTVPYMHAILPKGTRY